MRKSIVISFVSVLALALINGCTPNTDSMANGATAVPAMTVRTAIVEKQSVERKIEYTSTLVPFEEVHFSPSSPGRIESLKVNIGDKVAKGALIAVMDETQLNQAKTQLANLEIDYRRLDTLIKTGSIPQQQYDQIKTQYEVAKTNYEYLRKNTRLTAPFEGIISGKYYEEGEMYSGAPNAQVGKAAIVSIIRIDPIKAVVNISERYFPSIKKGMDAEVLSDIYPGETFTGEIIRIHPVVDQATRTFQVEVKVRNREEKLRPGMFARINLHMGQDKALLIPSVAVLKQTGTNERYVFVRNNNKAAMKRVTVGKIYDDNLEIISGLDEGEELIVVGQNKLADQSEIEVVE